VDTKILDVDSALGDAGAAASFEDVDRLIGVCLRHPAPHRAAAEPFVLKRAELGEGIEAADFAPRVPIELLGVVEPKRRAGRGIEVPGNALADPCIQPLAGGTSATGKGIG